MTPRRWRRQPRLELVWPCHGCSQHLPPRFVLMYHRRVPEFVVIKHLPLTSPKLFFGRDEELGWLEKCWTERVFVASISAWGGVGKTSLVTKWLCAMRDAGWPGAERVFVWSFYGQGMRTAGSSDGFFAKALEALGDADPLLGSPWEKGERLGKLVREKRTLLVLDGVEPMQWGPGEQEGRFKDPALQTLVQDLAVNNNGFLLMTSRLPVRDAAGLAGEKVRSRELKHLSPEAGADLLRARKVQGTDEELRQASTEYGGHALALTLLGSYLEDVADGDIRRRNEIGSLLHDEREGGHARRVMASYEPLLGQTERAILRMLGLFDRPATDEEITALRAEPVVLGLTDSLVNIDGCAWNKALAKLRRIGLVGVKIGNDIDAHPLVRQHFGEQLKNENIDAFCEGHRRLYEFLRTNTKELPDTIAEMEPLYKAVVHGCLAGKKQDTFDNVWIPRIRRGDNHYNLTHLGAFGHEVVMLSAYFDPAWEQPAPEFGKADQALILNDTGYVLRVLGRLQEAADVLTKGLAQRIGLMHWQGAVRTCSNLTDLYLSGGYVQEAIQLAQASVVLADRSEDTFLRLAMRSSLATCTHATGRFAEAGSLFEEAERIQAEREPKYPLLDSERGFRYCDFLLDMNHVVDVRERAAITQIWAFSEMRILDIALDHVSLGRAHLVGVKRHKGGDLQEAISHIRQAVDGLRGAGYHQLVPLGLLARADLHIHTREFAKARRDLDEAITIATRCGFRLHECDAHLGYARLAIAEGNRAKAGEHLEKARRIVEETGYHRRDEELAAVETQIAQMNQPVEPPIVDSNLDHEPVVEGRTHVSIVHDNERFDIAIICAVPTELEKIKDTGLVEWAALPHSAHDPSTYYQTIYTTTKTKKALKVVASMATQMGMPAAAVLATKMIRRFQPHLLAMVGIAAGAKSDKQNYGNILAPSQTFDYNSGKILLKENQLCFEPDPNPLPLSARMVGRLQEWASTRRHLDSIRDKWPIGAQRKHIDLHVGPMGSGAAVVDVPKPVMDVMEHWRKLIGIEMEAYAAHLACHQAIDPPCEFLCMKSISDFAGGNKDEWRDYAAYTSAQLCHRFLTEEWENLFPR